LCLIYVKIYMISHSYLFDGFTNYILFLDMGESIPLKQ
jgi:hypothetical protein